MYTKRQKKWMLIWTLIVLFFIMVTLVAEFAWWCTGDPHPYAPLAIPLIGVIPAGICFGWIVITPFSRALGDNAVRAVQPLPDPVSLHNQLSNELGRPPSEFEMQMAYQHLQEQRRQATVNAALGAGLLYGVFHATRRR